MLRDMHLDAASGAGDGIVKNPLSMDGLLAPWSTSRPYYNDNAMDASVYCCWVLCHALRRMAHAAADA